MEHKLSHKENLNALRRINGQINGVQRMIEDEKYCIEIMDGKHPEHWPSWLLKLFVCTGRSFGLSLDYIKRRPWESLERHFQQAAFEQMYGGMMYISSGTTPFHDA